MTESTPITENTIKLNELKVLAESLPDKNSTETTELSATQSKVLSGETFIGKSGIQETGTMINHETTYTNQTFTSNDSYLIPAGYHESGTIKVQVSGTSSSGGINITDATATAKDIVSGKVAYGNNNKRITGTMPNGNLYLNTNLNKNTGKLEVESGANSTGYISPNTTQIIAKTIDLGKPEFEIKNASSGQIQINTTQEGYANTGYSQKIFLSSIDENLTPENIKKGITILGTEGTYTGTPQSTYTIQNAYGDGYGFYLNNDNFYYSSNRWDDSYSLCKVTFNCSANCVIKVTCDCGGESYYCDYGFIGNLDTDITSTDNMDELLLIKLQNITNQTYSIDMPEGQHFLIFGYIKDSSYSNEKDYFRFKINNSNPTAEKGSDTVYLKEYNSINQYEQENKKYVLIPSQLASVETLILRGINSNNIYEEGQIISLSCYKNDYNQYCTGTIYYLNNYREILSYDASNIELYHTSKGIEVNRPSDTSFVFGCDYYDYVVFGT